MLVSIGRLVLSWTLMPRLVFSRPAGSAPRGRCGGVDEACSFERLHFLSPLELPNVPSGYASSPSRTSGNSVPGKCRCVKGMLLPVELFVAGVRVNLSPHGQGGALPRISFRCPRLLTGQSLVEFDDHHQALHMCDAVMPFPFAGDLF